MVKNAYHRDDVLLLFIDSGILLDEWNNLTWVPSKQLHKAEYQNDSSELYVMLVLICGNGTVWLKTHVPFPLHSMSREVKGQRYPEAREASLHFFFFTGFYRSSAVA